MPAVLEPLSESDLRAFVRGHLDDRAASPGLRVFEELAIERGAARVDLALVGERLEAFELKSDRDNFGRMHNQIHAYNRVFDQITLVTGASLADAALALIPKWWGIWVLHRAGGGGISMERVRDATDNPRQELLSLAALLWREEAADVLLNETGAPPPKRASRTQLCERIAQQVQLPTLRQHVARRLVSRQAAEPKMTRSARAPYASVPGDGWSHHDANCLDFHFPA